MHSGHDAQHQGNGQYEQQLDEAGLAADVAMRPRRMLRLLRRSQQRAQTLAGEPFRTGR